MFDRTIGNVYLRKCAYCLNQDFQDYRIFRIIGFSGLLLIKVVM